MKACIYPYTEDAAPIIMRQLSEYEVISLVDETAQSCEGDDLITNNFAEGIQDADALILMDCNVHFAVKKHDLIIEHVKMAVQHIDKLINTMMVDTSLIKEIKSICADNGIEYIEYRINKIFGQDEYLFDFNCPIVFVLGENENTDKFLTQLSLREKLIRDGYRVSQVGSRHYCELFGFHSFPDFMFDVKGESDKIYEFNHYLKDIENKEKPDIILIGIPGSIMPHDKKSTRHFGIAALEVSMAVTPDFAIYNMHEDKVYKEYMELTKNLLLYRFCIEVDCYNIANKRVLWPESRELGDYEYLTVDKSKVLEMVRGYQYECPVFSTVDENDQEDLYQFLLKTLIGYQEEGVI